MNEIAILAFAVASHLAQYDKLYFTSRSHLDSTIDWYVEHMLKNAVSVDAVNAVRRIAADHYGSR